MSTGPSIAQVAALLGDPARANMLNALMDGRALTAGELAFVAGVSAPTASAHLAKLTEMRLLAVAKQGRHRYFGLASPLVGRMLESISAVAALEAPPRHRPRSAADEALRRARTCYDHLAGRLAVNLADRLTARRLVVLDTDGGVVTPAGVRVLADFGVDLPAARAKRRVFCRPCLDWSERRAHIAGAVGAALAQRCFELGWLTRVPDSRAVTVSDAGRTGLRDVFGLGIEATTGPG